MMRKKVIIDCDPGIDDAFALVLALKCEELDILGITTLGGNIQAISAAKNALKILKLMDRLDIPVCMGAEGPLKRKLVTAKEVHGKDGLGNAFLDDVDASLLHEDAAGFILNTLKENEDVSIIALAPLTNLATAMKRDMDTFNNVKEIVSMGGAFRVPGNCSPVGEFNYWVDPHAAEYVLENIKAPFTMVGLDVTSKVTLTPSHMELFRHFDTAVSRFLFDASRFYLDFYWNENRIIGCLVHDALALAYFVDNTLCDGFDSYVQVVEEGAAMGQTIVDENNFYDRKPNCRVLTEVSAERFFKLFFNKVFDQFKEDYEKSMLFNS